MNVQDLVRRIANNHNRLVSMIENGVDLKSSNNVFLVADALRDLRCICEELRDAGIDHVIEDGGGEQ